MPAQLPQTAVFGTNPPAREGTPDMADTPLSERIQAALRAGKSQGVEALIFEAEAAAKQAVADHDAAKERALDPLLSDSEIAAARKAMEDANFTSERMTKAAAVLREKLSEFNRAEENDARRKVYDAALARRNAASACLRADYPDLAHKLGALLAEVVGADAAVTHANRRLPDGVTEILPVERHARPTKEHIVPGGQKVPFIPNDSSWPTLTRKIVLPAFECGRHPPIWGPDNSLSRGFHFTPELTNGGRVSAASGVADERPAKPAGEGGVILSSASPVSSNSSKENAA
ncbi:hypothetical protein [Jiella sonneratiae]|uniref:Uncharacterized protein n=1 Tax=Jiella sonneratiae TaxID=2816856 RepID=A0ABS3J3V8_9HYPH|nr:hypothetical protein [Jiella sonneratiae]MBO0903805.1 hypothetical protein [Jiella sonneratiae]